MIDDRLKFPLISEKYIMSLFCDDINDLTEDKILMLDQEDFIRACYRFFFDREADEGGLIAHLNLLNSGLSKEGMLHYFSRTDEFKGEFQLRNKDIYRRKYLEYQWDAKHLLRYDGYRFIEECYHFLLERDPDETGLYLYMKEYYKGVPKEGIILFFLDSAEIKHVKSIKDYQFYAEKYSEYCKNHKENSSSLSSEIESFASMHADSAVMYHDMKRLVEEIRQKGVEIQSESRTTGEVVISLLHTVYGLIDDSDFGSNVKNK